MKIEVTKAQLEAIKDLTNDCSAMVGGGDEKTDKLWKHRIMMIDKMLTKNNLKPRDFK